MMSIEELEELRANVKEAKRANIEARYRITSYALTNYLRCLVTFGPFAQISKDCFAIIKEYNAIISEENYLLSRMMETDTDVERIFNFFRVIDEISEETIIYYYKLLDDIEDACAMSDASRGKRDSKSFATLIETSDYRDMLDAINVTLEDVKAFLEFPQDFWDYIEPRIIWGEEYEERPRSCYHVNITNNDTGHISDISVVLPRVVDLPTAKICVHELKVAYHTYKLLGSLTILKDTTLDDCATDMEKQFQNKITKK